MDQLTLQRSLTDLENRYRELREIGESRLQAWEAEKVKLNQKLDTVTHANDSLLADVKTLGQLTDVLTSEKKDLEAKLEQADLKMNDYLIEKIDLQSQLEAALLRSGNTQDLEARLEKANLAIASIGNAERNLESQLRKALSDSSSLNDERQKLQGELVETREETELRMLQLLQAQEELQHYFLRCRELSSEYAQAMHDLALASEALQEVLSSTSWRMTYPLRWALDQCRLLRREGPKKGFQLIAKKVAGKVSNLR